MAVIRLRHVKRVRSKGRTYWYHRVTGERLPKDRDERIKRVVDINAGLGPKRIAGPRSVAAVVSAYKASPGYRDLAPKTRRNYALYLDILCQTIGTAPVAGIRRKHVLALRDKYAETPSKANYLVTVLRILLAFAIDREEITTNPARDIKNLKTGDGHQAWPDEAIERFLEVAPPMMVLALRVGLYTGQREGDCLTMTWHDYDGAHIQVVQSKTGTKLSIPVHSALREALDAQERVSPAHPYHRHWAALRGQQFPLQFQPGDEESGTGGPHVPWFEVHSGEAPRRGRLLAQADRLDHRAQEPRHD